MKTYIYLQIKRVMKVLPMFLLVVLILLLSLAAVFVTVSSANQAETVGIKTKIAYTGNIEGTYLETGLNVIKEMDSTQYTIEFVEMDKEEAFDAVRKMEVAACAIIPDNFAAEAWRGNILPITYVTVNDPSGLTPFFKDEVTKIISDALVEGLRCTYATQSLVYQYVDYDTSWERMNEMNIEYMDVLLNRDKIYTVKNSGLRNDMGFAEYLFCGISVLLLFLTALPFSLLFVRQDHSLQKLLSSRRIGSIKQITAELLSVFTGLFILFVCILIPVIIIVLFFNTPISTILPPASLLRTLLWGIPVILLISAMSLLIFELTDNLISGVLYHFFLTLSLCYISGCLYPIFAFPEIIQKIARLLPTGIARDVLGGALTGNSSYLSLMGLLIYSLIFYALTIIVRSRKIHKARG